MWIRVEWYVERETKGKERPIRKEAQDTTHKSPRGFEQHTENGEQHPNKWNMLLLLYNTVELMYVPYVGSLKTYKLLQQLDD